MKKVVSMIIILAMVMSLLAACSNGDIAVTIGDEKVTVGEATFVLRELEAMYEQQYGPEIWSQGYEGTSFDEIAKEGAMESITRLYVSKNVAAENKIELSEEELTEIDALMAQYLAIYTEENLSDDGITVEDVRSVFMLNAIGEKLMDVELVGFEVDQAELDTALANNPEYQQIEKFGVEGVLEQVTVQHVLITTLKDDGAEFTVEEKAEALVTAEEVLQKAKAGESFDQLVEDYSGDPGWIENGGIYTFYRGEMVPEFEDVSFTMEIDDIQLIESSFGYHIINKQAHTYPDDTQIQSVNDYQAYLVEQYTTTQKQVEFDGLYAEWKANYDVSINEKVWGEVKTSYQNNTENSNGETPAAE